MNLSLQGEYLGLTNMPTLDKQKLIKCLPKIICQKLPKVRVIYMFGSYAAELNAPKSDIDIAVLVPNRLDSIERWQIQNELADELGKEVDLVDLLSASTVMQNQVIHQGICIYDEANHAPRFEMQVMSMYQHLNEERADILELYKKDKKA